MSERERIKITYSTLSSPNPLLDQYYDESLAEVKAGLGGTHPLYINGEWVMTEQTFSKASPIDTSIKIGTFAAGGQKEIDAAVIAARKAYPLWSRMPWQERNALLNKAADLISERSFEISAVVSLEIGKNRLEALGDVEESADLIRYCLDAMKDNDGFSKPLLQETPRHHNRSVLKPFGVWGVIAPFNFPAALSAGPVGGALTAGNTVVLKPADDAPLTSVMIAQCFHDAGLPAGVFNMVLGGDEPGKALVANPDIDGITFTGSYAVGMSIIRQFAGGGAYPRPVIAEMGGKNPTIVTDKADLDKAAIGIMRSAFGLTGQKCSACSRVYAHESIKDELIEKLVKVTREKVTVGDPTDKSNYMGPIINATAYAAYKRYVADLKASGKVILGGEPLSEKGYFVAPTIVTDLPEDHYLWGHEMFAPIVVIDAYTDENEAMSRANNIDLGLTAGFYSEDEDEVAWFLDQIEAGTLYINRETGATTGAWPGYQSFGGWKGSSGTSKAAGSFYYLQQYMKEQSQTIVH